VLLPSSGVAGHGAGHGGVAGATALARVQHAAAEAHAAPQPRSLGAAAVTLAAEFHPRAEALAVPLKSEADLLAEARMRGYEGAACDECGNFTMVRNGTCLKCDTCGGTSGCS